MTGLRTTSEGWGSTYRLSHFAGQVILVNRPQFPCLSGGVQSTEENECGNTNSACRGTKSFYYGLAPRQGQGPQ